MNILVCCGAFPPARGGAESLFHDLSRRIVDRGHRVTVVTRSLPGCPDREDMEGVEVLRFAYPVPYESLRAGPGWAVRSPAVLWRLWRLLRSRRITTVCIGLLDMSAGYLLALRSVQRFRLVTYLHGAEIRRLPGSSGAFRRLVRRALRTSDAVVAVSPGLAEDAIRLCPPVRRSLTVIPNGIVPGRIAAAAPHRRSRDYILYVGRLAPVKRVADILRAFARVSDRMRDIDLLLVGDGPDRESLARTAAALGLPIGRVEFVGAVEREAVYSYMRGSLFLVLASEEEAHPLVVMEARVAGKAVLAPRVTGIIEMIQPGVHGDLYPPADTEALATLMARYVADGALRTDLESRIAMSDPAPFDLDGSFERHIDVLRGFR